jgi:hypothetical protein
MTRFLLATTAAACSATVSFSESVNGPSTVTAAGALSLVIFDPSGGGDAGDRGRPPSARDQLLITPIYSLYLSLLPPTKLRSGRPRK